MATWQDVEEIALALDGARPGIADHGGPTVDVGRHPFARLRWDDEGRELLQFWSKVCLPPQGAGRQPGSRPRRASSRSVTEASAPTSTAGAHTPSECRAAPQPSAVACRSAASASLTDHS